MTFYVINTIFKIAKSFSKINLQQVSKQIFQVTAKVPRKPNLEKIPATYNKPGL